MPVLFEKSKFMVTVSPGLAVLFSTVSSKLFAYVVFEHMKKLKSLCVFGGEDYDIPFINLDKLIPLENKNVLILGSGGTSKTARCAAGRLGAKKCAAILKKS